MKNSKRILCGFLCGQIVQVVMSIIATAMGVSNVILWASAAGFLITVAVLVGMELIRREWRETTMRIGGANRGSHQG